MGNLLNMFLFLWFFMYFLLLLSYDHGILEIYGKCGWIDKYIISTQIEYKKSMNI